jgi:urease accessory protein
MTLSSQQALSGNLRLVFKGRSDGSTQLVGRHRSGLFHFGKEYREGRFLVLQVLNPTAGVFARDHLVSEVVLEADSKACLMSPSSTQVYTMPCGGRAVSEQDFRLESGSSLVYLPRALVLHRGSRFHSSTRISIKRGASLLFLDLISPGRTASGEYLEFDELDVRMSIHLDGQLLLKERMQCGREFNRWMWRIREERAVLFANLHISFPDAATYCKSVLSPLMDLGPDQPVVGFSPLDSDFVICRIMSSNNVDMQNVVRRACNLLDECFPLKSIHRRIS